MHKFCSQGHAYLGERCPQCNKTSARGYDHRWRKLSEDYRIRNPLCEDCDAQGRTTPAAEVHHIVPISQDPSKRLDVNNLVALCKQCHDLRHDKGHEQDRSY